MHLMQLTEKADVVANLVAAWETIIVLLWSSDMDYTKECLMHVKYGLIEAVLESYMARMSWGHITIRSCLDTEFHSIICSLLWNACIRWAWW